MGTKLVILNMLETSLDVSAIVKLKRQGYRRQADGAWLKTDAFPYSKSTDKGKRVSTIRRDSQGKLI